MMMWKIVGVLKVSVLYIYIYIDKCLNNKNNFFLSNNKNKNYLAYSKSM